MTLWDAFQCDKRATVLACAWYAEHYEREYRKNKAAFEPFEVFEARALARMDQQLKKIEVHVDGEYAFVTGHPAFTQSRGCYAGKPIYYRRDSLKGMRYRILGGLA